MASTSLPPGEVWCDWTSKKHPIQTPNLRRYDWKTRVCWFCWLILLHRKKEPCTNFGAKTYRLLIAPRLLVRLRCSWKLVKIIMRLGSKCRKTPKNHGISNLVVWKSQNPASYRLYRFKTLFFGGSNRWFLGNLKKPLRKRCKFFGPILKFKQGIIVNKYQWYVYEIIYYRL